MNIILELGKFLISTTVFGGLIVWIFKEYLKLRFSKGLEKSKGEIDNYFHNEKLKFAKLHEERAIVLKELYFKLYNYHKALKCNLNDVVNVTTVQWNLKKQNIDNTFLTASEFDEYFEKNRIFFSPIFCKKVHELKESHLNAMKMITITHFIASSMESEKDMGKRVKEYSEYETKLKEIMQNEIPNIEKDIESEFRKILGVME